MSLFAYFREVCNLRTAIGAWGRVVRVGTSSRAMYCDCLFVGLIGFRRAAFLSKIVAGDPSVANVRGDHSVRFPGRVDAVFCVRIRFCVADLISGIRSPVLAAFVGAESWEACEPPACAIHTAKGVPLFGEGRFEIAVQVDCPRSCVGRG